MDEAHALEGRIIKSHGNRFIVQTADGTYDCGLRGRFRRTGEKTRTPVAVGDRVSLTVDKAPYGVIESVFPRRNKISRPDVLKPDWEQVLVTNSDQFVVVASLARPRLRYGAVDRFLLTAAKEDLDALVVLNKTDLVTENVTEHAVGVYRRAGYTVIPTSAEAGTGIEELKERVRLKTSLFAGHSGVGKSSLINVLEPGLDIRTRRVSAATGKGAHTTTVIELHHLSFGGYIADMPGMKVIGLWDLDADELPDLYPEFVPLLGACRFANCIHIGEPDCAIKTAVDDGRISRERYDGYQRIRASLIAGR